VSDKEREREVKLAVPAGFRLPSLTDPEGGTFEGTSETIHLDAIYYDTSDSRLARAGASLRHRNDGGWTVKLPVASDGEGLERDEHHFTGPATTPPQAAVDLVRALVRSAELARVARLQTTRRSIPVLSVSGEVIATVVDDRVEVPVVHGPDPYDRVVRAAFAACVQQIIDHDPRIRVGGDPEDVHQARVGTRRLRSHLGTFKSLLDERWVSGLRDELRWLGDVLGAVRDAEVLLERLEGKVARLAPVDGPAAEKLLDHLRADLDRRREQLVTAMRKDRYVSLLDRVVDAARRPRLLLRVDHDSDAEVLRSLVRKRWSRLEAAVDELGPDPEDAQLHEIRIDAKRARYAAEAVTSAFGKPARAFAKALTGLQDVLGEHQDAVIAAEWLRANAASRADAMGFAAGQLAALERQDALAARQGWQAAWKQASRGRLRKWL